MLVQWVSLGIQWGLLYPAEVVLSTDELIQGRQSAINVHPPCRVSALSISSAVHQVLCCVAFPLSLVLSNFFMPPLSFSADPLSYNLDCVTGALPSEDDTAVAV